MLCLLAPLSKLWAQGEAPAQTIERCGDCAKSSFVFVLLAIEWSRYKNPNNQTKSLKIETTPKAPIIKSKSNTFTAHINTHTHMHRCMYISHLTFRLYRSNKVNKVNVQKQSSCTLDVVMLFFYCIYGSSSCGENILFNSRPKSFVLKICIFGLYQQYN